jgi:dsRNA-specific ribonuclease
MQLRQFSLYTWIEIEEANKFILEKFMDIINKAIQNKIILDFKTKLQEFLQVNGEVNINYELLYEGPPHQGNSLLVFLCLIRKWVKA